jgi:ribosomal protein S18 acetylase RimI-like enzyme
MHVRKATDRDHAAVAAILLPIIEQGETYAIDRHLGEKGALDYWFGPDKTTFVVEDQGAILGTYYIKQNQGGGGAHVCNCGYMTSSTAVSRGVARSMCEHSLKWARLAGYKAMQFNFVVSTNERAVRLWQSLDFEIVGRLPSAFNHPGAGYVDALVMYREL